MFFWAPVFKWVSRMCIYRRLFSSSDEIIAPSFHLCLHNPPADCNATETRPECSLLTALVLSPMSRSAAMSALSLRRYSIFRRTSHLPRCTYAVELIRAALGSLFQGLVIAGLSDLARPADQLSIAQSGSLAATGIIWSRYSLVIIPKNYGLFSVNLFVAFTSTAQLYRAWDYNRKKEQELKALETSTTAVVAKAE